MDRMFKHEVIAHLITTILLISLLSTRVAYASSGSVRENYGYGYGCLPEKLCNLYEKLTDCAEAFVASEAFLTVDDPLSDTVARKLLTASMKEYCSDEEIIETYDYFRWDNPQYFWLARSVSRRNEAGRTAVTICVGASFKDAANRAEAKADIDKKSVEWINSLIGLETDDEKCMELHRLISEAADYVYEDDGTTPKKDDWSHSMAGVFTGKGAICEGYSAAFAYILKELGVECIQVCGKTHIWNAAYTEQGWNFYDITWDDLEGEMNYFAKAIDDQGFLGNHRITQVDVNDYEASYTESYRVLPWEI